MARYFNNANTLEELKKHHPDNGGSVEITKAINTEYDKLFKILKDKHESNNESAGSSQSDTNNAKSAYNANMYDWENDKALREVLQKIINFSGIEINVVGAWIWLDGNTYPYKESLKELGFRWSKQHRKCHWHNGEFRRKGNSKLTYVDIQNLYGSTSVHTMQRELLEA